MTDFEFCTEEMWQFVNSRYGSDTVIKRFYQKSKYSYYSEVELRMKLIPVIICTSQKLLANQYNEQNFLICTTQMSKRANFSELKKRVVDHLIQMGEADATTEKVRLWSCNNKEKLLQSYKQIGTSLKEAATQETNTEDIERNSGVDFPGQSLEPIIGTQLTLDEKEFNGEVVFVEYGHPTFAY